MTLRRMAAVLATVMAMGTVLVATSDGPSSSDDHASHQARTMAREIEHLVHDALREAGHEVRHVVRDVLREVHAAHEWTRESTAEQRERRREARDQWRDQLDRRRDARDRERSERAFRQVSPTDDACARNSSDDRNRACEVRDTRLGAPVGALTVDASPNGGIRVEGWDQPDVLVRAVVQTWGDDANEAKAMLPQVHVTAAGTRVSAEGPARSDGPRRTGWSVSFQIWAPRATALALSARNGGIAIHAMRGESRFTTENGGVTLDDMGGQVAGTTRNGGVNVRLSGAQWEGAGLDVETTNGGVTLAVPANYSAALEVGTVNGGVRSDVPLTVQGRLDRQVRTTLGSGGPLLKLRTTNGGVRINAR